MGTRRVILGNLGGGQYGLRVALPGHDVISEAGNQDALSFDSGWTDIVKMIQVGTATASGSNVTPMDLLFPDQGYKPFVEVRLRSGLRVYDDYTGFGNALYPGIGANILTDRLQLTASSTTAWSYDVVYAIFRVPAPAT